MDSLGAVEQAQRLDSLEVTVATLYLVRSLQQVVVKVVVLPLSQKLMDRQVVLVVVVKRLEERQQMAGLETRHQQHLLKEMTGDRVAVPLGLRMAVVAVAVLTHQPEQVGMAQQQQIA